MAARIGLIGIPLETIPVMLESDNPIYSISAYLPGLTDKTRKMILERARQSNICLEDFGEICLGEYYKPDFSVNTSRGISVFHAEKLAQVGIGQLEKERKEFLKRVQDYDLVVAIGANHLGGIVLYEENDIVARLDYHSDFSTSDAVILDYASYMVWVKRNIQDIAVTNYFVKYAESGGIFGEEGRIGDGQYARANHFDIDVDCFNRRFMIQNVYTHDQGPSEATPEMMLDMIKEAMPRKIGIWEYRPERDSGAGLEFIVEAIKNAAY